MYHKFINHLKSKSEFSRNLLVLMGGSTVAQAIPIAISPILTRLYSPEDFGILALYLGIFGILSITVTGRYELAIPLPRGDREAINLFALSLIITTIWVLVSIVVIILFKDSILEILNAKPLGNLLYLIPLSLLFAGLNKSLRYWSNRKKYFKAISLSQILQSSSSASIQLIFNFLYKSIGLIGGNIVGMMLSTYILLKRFLKSDRRLISKIKRVTIISQMKRYRDFPLINSLHAFSDVARISGSVMLISSFFGVEVLGFYSLALRILQLPLGILGSSLGQILYQKLSSLHSDGHNLYPYIKKSLIRLTLLSIPIFAILYIMVSDIFASVFGEEWREAGEYSQALIPYLFMSFIISPISTVPIILDRQKSFFYMSLVGNIGMPSIIIICSNLGYDIKEILSITSLFLALLYLLMLWWIVRIANSI